MLQYGYNLEFPTAQTNQTLNEWSSDDQSQTGFLHWMVIRWSVTDRVLTLNGHPMISHRQGSYTEWFMRRFSAYKHLQCILNKQDGEP